MKKSELIKLLEKITDDSEVIIDIGRYSNSNWKHVEDVDHDYVNDQKVIVIR